MLIQALKRQFNDAFGVLQAAIGSFTDEQWRRGSSPFNGPGRAAVHVLQSTEYYTCEDRAVFENFEKPISQMSDEDVPPQERLIGYLDLTRRKTLAWIESLGEPGLRAPVDGNNQLCGMDRVAYALRHLQHHIGEICAYQKQAGLEPAQWK